MRLIGLTGRSGCGKSTVATIAHTLHIPVLDCDAIYREMTSSESPFLDAVASTFGKNTVTQGVLNRAVLRQKVFSDKEALHKLNALTTLYMCPEIDKRLMRVGDALLVLLDAPTLFESGLDAMCELIIGVVASDTVCIDRIVQRDHIEQEAAKLRLDNQKSNVFFIKHCDIILYNECDEISFRNKTVSILQALQKGEI